MYEVTTDTFDAEVRQAAQPVVVDFWSPRCGPCLVLMPLVEKLSEQYNGRLKIVKINAQESRQLCVQLKVMSLPTFLFFNGGQEVDRLTGDVRADRLSQWIEEKLAQLSRSGGLRC
jgi:thioredoxin 1